MLNFSIAKKELIDIVNEKNELTGDVENLRDAHFKSLWHRASHIWIYNSKGEVLLQKRASIKNYFPALFDISAAGHINSGESPLLAAIRETKEELGIDISEEELDFIKEFKESVPINDYFNNEFDYIYLLKWEGDSSSLKLQKNEVEYVKFVLLDKFEKDINSNEYNKYVPHKKEYYKLIISEIKKRINK